MHEYFKRCCPPLHRERKRGRLFTMLNIRLPTVLRLRRPKRAVNTRIMYHNTASNKQTHTHHPSPDFRPQAKTRPISSPATHRCIVKTRAITLLFPQAKPQSTTRLRGSTEIPKRRAKRDPRSQGPMWRKANVAAQPPSSLVDRY
jgi:hypothetical protein